jgi:hypothetical protein
LVRGLDACGGTRIDRDRDRDRDRDHDHDHDRDRAHDHDRDRVRERRRRYDAHAARCARDGCSREARRKRRKMRPAVDPRLERHPSLRPRVHVIPPER